MGHMGPIRGGGAPPRLGAKGGAHPPFGRRTSPRLGVLVPHEGGEEYGTPLAYIRRGTPPFFSTQLEFLFSLFLLPRADSPCLEFAPSWEFSTKARHRFA